MPIDQSQTADLRSHLVRTGLAGDVQTSPGETVENCHKFADGNPVYTFGLSDWTEAEPADAVNAVAELCGKQAVTRPAAGPGWIDPDATLEGIERHREGIAAAADVGASVLLATGHPTGLLAHYGTIARHLAGAGCRVLTPLDDAVPDGHDLGVRYLGGVACTWNGGDLLHRHQSDLMEAMLDTLRDGPPDLVIGDHGWAGAAVERGIETLSIADVNDPALQVAQVRGRTDGVLVIDDNLAPTIFEPVTAAMLEAR